MTSGKLDAALQLAARLCLAFSHKRLVEATAQNSTCACSICEPHHRMSAALVLSFSGLLLWDAARSVRQHRSARDSPVDANGIALAFAVAVGGCEVAGESDRPHGEVPWRALWLRGRFSRTSPGRDSIFVITEEEPGRISRGRYLLDGPGTPQCPRVPRHHKVPAPSAIPGLGPARDESYDCQTYRGREH